MIYSLLLFHLHFFLERFQVKMVCYLGTVSSFVLAGRINWEGYLYKCYFYLKVMKDNLVRSLAN